MSKPSKLFSLIKPNEKLQNVTEQELNCYVDAISKFAVDVEYTTNEFLVDNSDNDVCYDFINGIANVENNIKRQKPYTYAEVKDILDNKLYKEEKFSLPLKLDFNKFFLNLVMEDFTNFSKNSNEPIKMQPINQNDPLNINFLIDKYFLSTKDPSMYTCNTSEITPLSFTIKTSFFHKDFETELYNIKQKIVGGFKRRLKTKRQRYLRK